jgi:hypothetical protein
LFATAVDVETLLPEKRSPRWDTGIKLHHLKGDILYLMPAAFFAAVTYSMHCFSFFFVAAALALVMSFSAMAFFVALETFMIIGSTFAMSAEQSAIAGVARAPMNATATADATSLCVMSFSVASALRSRTLRHQGP